MKEVYFVRHAKSSWDDPWLADHDRPLNKRGKNDAPFMAQVMAAKVPQVDAIVSSTAKRARKTAEAFATAYGLQKQDIKLIQSLYHASTYQITANIKQFPAAWSRVIVFGHNPGYTDLANELAGSYIDNVPTCGIFGTQSSLDEWIEWAPKSALRTSFLYPKLYK